MAYFDTSNRPDRAKWNSDSDLEIEQLGAKLLVDITSNLFRRNDDGTLESTYGLETLVCLLSGFDASDPRDTINALINISSEKFHQNTDPAYTIPAPNYSKNLFEVYRDFVRWRGPNGTPVGPSYRRSCQYVLLKLTRNGHINIDKLLRVIKGPTKDYLERVRSVTWDRSFIEGKPSWTRKILPSEAAKKLVGLAPPKTKTQDVIAVLYGCSVPVILRPTIDAHGNKCHQFIGEAFIYGKMDGEALRGGYEETQFCLI